jgi:hypothetical protein
MKESDVHGVGEEQGRLLSGESPVGKPGDARTAPEPPKREADDWLAFAAEDPAFFIKPADAV